MRAGQEGRVGTPRLLRTMCWRSRRRTLHGRRRRDGARGRRGGRVAYWAVRGLWGRRSEGADAPALRARECAGGRSRPARRTVRSSTCRRPSMLVSRLASSMRARRSGTRRRGRRAHKSEARRCAVTYRIADAPPVQPIPASITGSVFTHALRRIYFLRMDTRTIPLCSILSASAYGWCTFTFRIHAASSLAPVAPCDSTHAASVILADCHVGRF